MKKQRDILFILISSFILTVIWIFANVKHNLDTSTVSDIQQVEINPIVPRFDNETFTAIKNRNNVDPQFEAQSAASTAATTPTVTPTPIRSKASLKITPTVTASSSGR